MESYKYILSNEVDSVSLRLVYRSHNFSTKTQQILMRFFARGRRPSCNFYTYLFIGFTAPWNLQMWDAKYVKAGSATDCPGSDLIDSILCALSRTTSLICILANKCLLMKPRNIFVADSLTTRFLGVFSNSLITFPVDFICSRPNSSGRWGFLGRVYLEWDFRCHGSHGGPKWPAAF